MREAIVNWMMISYDAISVFIKAIICVCVFYMKINNI
jgi:hypothetical protein